MGDQTAGSGRYGSRWVLQLQVCKLSIYEHLTDFDFLCHMLPDRGAYIDQSQSFNVHMSDPNFGKLTSLHFYAWKKGLKTGLSL